jgi:DNA-binding IclR family transcriptional regulator
MDLVPEDVVVHAPSPVVSTSLELLDKIVAILDAVEHLPGSRLPDVAARTGIPKPTCHRLLQSLVRHHLLWRDGTRYYCGARLAWYAASVWQADALAHRARPALRALAEQTDLGAVLVRRADGLRVTVAVAGRPECIRAAWGAGQVGVAYAGATGKVLLAWLPRHIRDEVLSQVSFQRVTPRTPASREALEQDLAVIRAQGWGFTWGEREPDTFGLAAPVFDPRGEIAAVGIAGHVSRWRETRLEAWARALWETGRALSQPASRPYPAFRSPGRPSGPLVMGPRGTSR